MDELPVQFADLVVRQTIQVTLLILVTGLLTRWLFRHRPYMSLALWLVVLVKCLVPPLVYSPLGIFCHRPMFADAYSVRADDVRARVVASGGLGYGLDQKADIPAASTVAGEGDLLTGGSHTPTAWRGRVPVLLARGLPYALGTWALGALAMLLANSLRIWRFTRHIQAMTEGNNDPSLESLQRLVTRLARYVGLGKIPRLVISPGEQGPAVCGLLRPTMILPKTLVQSVSFKELTPIVLHELIHVRRGDLWLALYAALLRTIWWFHPLVWWAVRQAEWESERCCDESVVAFMPRSPARYARSLICALEQSHRLQVTSLVPGVRPVDITAMRLERIMKLGHGSHKWMPWGCWGWAIMAAGLVVPGAAGSLAQTPEEPLPLPVVQSGDLTPARANFPDASMVEVTGAGKLPGSQEQPASEADPVIVKIYAVADLLTKLAKEDDWPEDVQDEPLKLALSSLLRLGSGLMEPPKSAEPVAGTRVAAGSRAIFAWNQNQLVVSAKSSEHGRLAQEIERRRKHSFRQVSIEVRIFRGSPDLCEQETVQVAGKVDDPVQAIRSRWILFPHDFQGLQSPIRNVMPASYEEIAPLSNADAGRPSAKVTTDKSNPVVYQFLDDNQFRSFFQVFSSDERNNIMMAPKVTLFDGQTAEISDASERPFVTDVEKIVGDTEVTYQPVIQVFWEGTRIELEPTITPDGMRLKCRFRFASIDGCKNFRSPRIPDAENVVIQHPVISTATFACNIDIPAEQTLMVGGLFPSTTERREEQSAIGRWLGREPATVSERQVTYIAITPRPVQ